MSEIAQINRKLDKIQAMLSKSMNEELLTIEAAAEFLGVKPNTVRAYISTGQIPKEAIKTTVSNARMIIKSKLIKS